MCVVNRMPSGALHSLTYASLLLRVFAVAAPQTVTTANSSSGGN
jgi:hypothetical protein